MQFKDIIGQRPLINRLTEVIDSGKVSHAQLFCGRMGYGTLALALAYVQYLNCQNRKHYAEPGTATGLRADSCGECPSCKKIGKMVFSDLHFIFPNAATSKVESKPSSADFYDEFSTFVTENRGYCTTEGWFRYLGVESKQGIINVRDANEIIRLLGLKTYESQYKSAIVWMPEKMNIEASNKLLKTLEEPSSNTLIIMVAENTDRLLSTIVSRTQSVIVHKIDAESLAQALVKSHPELPVETINQAAAAAQGDYLAACEMLGQSEQKAYFAKLFMNWMRQLFKLNMQPLSKTVDEISSLGREQQKQFLRYVLEVVRACFLKNIAGTDAPYTLKFDDQKFTTAFPTMITVNNIEKLENIINESLYSIERNSYSKITFMNLSFVISKLLKNR